MEDFFRKIIRPNSSFGAPEGRREASTQRVAPPDPRHSGRESRQKFDFLGWEWTPEAKKGEKGPRVRGCGREFA